ncbi:hypothetical protein L218DRAFT_953737 [Marasmius fiardii PR-910]|nr:hypothetical protein L218DRAFT_953737 [Marasmius fiardii PR-910]
MKSFLFVAPFLTAAYGHGFVSNVVGANKVSISGFGVTNGQIPRNGTSEQPFQLDTPVMKNLADDPCGATLQGGSIDINKSFQTALDEGNGKLPSLTSDGSLTMTIHQVNADGGGPFLAEFNTDGTGKNWQAATVTQQVPGAFGVLRGGPVNSQFTVQIPAGTTCTGGPSNDACILRINNGGKGNEASIANGAGPFGGCVPFTVDNNATGNSTQSNNGQNNGQNTNGRNRGQNNGAQAGTRTGAQRNRDRRQHQRDFSGAVNQRRQEEFIDLLTKRRQIDEELAMMRRELVERQLLTSDLIDEIKTVTGSAIDIPIDAFAGHVDADPNGGNSTTTKNPILTDQQAVDLKKAVQAGIEAGLSVLSSAQGVSVDAAGFSVAGKLTPAEIDAANRAAEQALADGSTTSVNQGNAGVGEPNTALLNQILGEVSGLRTLTLTTLSDGSAATALAGGNQNGASTAASSTITAPPTKATGNNGNGGNRQNNGGNGQNNGGNGQNNGGNNGGVQAGAGGGRFGNRQRRLVWT